MTTARLHTHRLLHKHRLSMHCLHLNHPTFCHPQSDLKPGSFRLELLGPPEDAETLPAAGPTPSTSASSGAGGAGGGAGPPAAAAAAAAAAAFAPDQGLATGFGHFSLVVPSTAAVVDALRAAGRADLILEECAAVIPVRSRGHSWTASALGLACYWLELINTCWHLHASKLVVGHGWLSPAVPGCELSLQQDRTSRILAGLAAPAVLPTCSPTPPPNQLKYPRRTAPAAPARTHWVIPRVAHCHCRRTAPAASWVAFAATALLPTRSPTPRSNQNKTAGPHQPHPRHQRLHLAADGGARRAGALRTV